MPQMKQILFPVDFSGPCARTASAVAMLAKNFKATVTLLHAASIPLLPEITYPERLYSALRKELQKDSTTAMERFVSRHFPAHAVKRVIEEGDPAQVIVDYTRNHKIDLIMMPTWLRCVSAILDRLCYREGSARCSLPCMDIRA